MGQTSGCTSFIFVSNRKMQFALIAPCRWPHYRQKDASKQSHTVFCVKTCSLSHCCHRGSLLTRANVLFTTAYIGAAALWKEGPWFTESKNERNLQNKCIKKEYISSRWCGCLCAGGRGVRKREIERISYIIHYRIKRVWPGLWLVSSEKCLDQKHWFGFGVGGCIIEGGELNVYYDELEGGCNRSHNRRNIARSIQQTSVTLPGPLIVSELFDFHATASE